MLNKNYSSFYKKKIDTIESILRELDLKLYDIDFPKSVESGIVRIFIYRDSPRLSNIGLDECSEVSRKIYSYDEEHLGTPIILNSQSLEVSTPGINRHLKSLEHFKLAVGERIKITFNDEKSGQKVSLLAFLEEVIDDVLHLRKTEKVFNRASNAVGRLKNSRKKAIAKASLPDSSCINSSDNANDTIFSGTFVVCYKDVIRCNINFDFS
jgi:ribosome maturation factor RimP